MPRNLIEELKKEVKGTKKVVVLPESEDERVIVAAGEILQNDYAKLILLGDEKEILEHAKKLNVDLSGAMFILPSKYEKIDEFAQEFAKMREKKGMTLEKAKQIMENDVRYFGAMLVRKGIANGMVAGSISPTADVLRAAIQVVGPKEGLKTVSSSFVMLTQDDTYGDQGVLIFSDSAVIPDPTPEQLADITISAVEKARLVGKIAHPKVALLSYSTKGSAGGPCVDKVAGAKMVLDSRNVDFDYDGELQLDAAIVPEVANLKAKDSSVAGSANVLIFPNLSAGNIGYKLVQRFARAKALGPFLQGLAKPIRDLSRGCSASDIVDVVVVTASEG